MEAIPKTTCHISHCEHSHDLPVMLCIAFTDADLIQAKNARAARSSAVLSLEMPHAQDARS